MAGLGRKCLFCNSPLSKSRAKEHVIPQWLMDHLHIRTTDLSP
jgi:hypothetical protein